MFEILKTYLGYAAIAALFVTSGILILNANRDAFEVDAQPTMRVPPVGGHPQPVWEWKYMSDFAQDARLLLIDIVKLLYFLIPKLMLILLGFFLCQVVIDFVVMIFGDKVPITLTLSNSTQIPLHLTDANIYLLSALNKIMLAVAGTFGPLFLWQLSKVIFLVIHARQNFRLNKP